MIDTKLLASFKERYDANPANAAVEHAIAKVGIKEASFNNEARKKHNYVFSDETDKGEITDQARTGRCWMFAGLNTARVNTMHKLNLKNFEFSQNYTLFWDKLEKANYTLENIIETVDEPLTSRLVWHLLQATAEDGGQWEMFADILRKYGSVPKELMPETFHSSNTTVLNEVLGNKLREFAFVLRDMHEKGASLEDLHKKKDEQLYFIYNLLVKTLGQVPEKVNYSYRDKDGLFHRVEEMTPQEFFATFGGLDLDNLVSLINAPTADKPYDKTYTVKFLGTIKEERPIKYLNVPIEELKKASIRAIKDGVPVWFGSDVGKFSENKSGIMDLDLFKYEDTLGENYKLNKAQRLDYSVSLLTHAMVLVGVDLDEDGNPINWKVENSWGKKVGDDGIFSMTDEWFSEYVYQITISSEYLDEKLVEEYKQEPIKLEPWDPMGALAQVH